MSMIRKCIRHWRYLPICFEALYQLLLCKLVVLLIPFARHVKTLGVAQCETLREDLGQKSTDLSAIRCALRVVPPCLPWKSLCLDQAMAAQKMLARRKLQSTLYLGVARGDQEGLIAHAWLRSGKHQIVGYQTAISYTIVGSYAWLP
jgi:hypothetical protein